MATTITYKGSDLTSFSNTSKTLRTAGKYLEGDITITAGADVNNQNKTVIPTEASQSITADTGYTGLGTVTVNGITNTYVGSSVPQKEIGDVSVTYSNNQINVNLPAGYYNLGGTKAIQPPNILPTQRSATIIPSETDQTAVDIHKWTTGTITVAAITSTYVGSSITRPGSSGISNSITNGYYKISVSPGYYPGTANKSLGLENPTIIPSETQQVKRPTSNNYYIESVTVAAITPTYVGSEVPTGSLTVSGPTVTASAGYYANAATETIPNASIRQYGVSRQSGATSMTYSISWNAIEPGYIDTNPTAKVTFTKESYSVTPTASTQTITPSGNMIYITDVTVEPIPSQYIVPSGTLTINSVDTTTTFDATNYASVNVNLKNADVTAY